MAANQANSTKRKMPSKRQIHSFWMDKIWEIPDRLHTCWGCGFDTITQRCHILARAEGGDDNPENLVILCKRCHLDQESMCMSETGRKNFIALLKDGALFMGKRIADYKHILEINGEITTT